MGKSMDESKPHMHDYEAHVRAVEEDVEYYRTKRFEPRIFYFGRRGVVTLYDILKAKSALDSKAKPSKGSDEGDKSMETRIRALEDALDDYVKGIGLVSSDVIKGAEMVIEDTRKERGDYDEFFRIKKKEHSGSLEERLERLEEDLRDYKMLLETFTYALIQKGLVTEDELNRRREKLYAQGVWNGARIVARAWVDPEFKANLMIKGREAVRELGIPPGRLGKLGTVENTESVHNVVVCTLCSCYPHDLLGDTPWWYKHESYKKRIIENPRATLEEMFELKIPSNMEIRVHDSTSDVRYMVLPRKPAGTENMSEEELQKLVTVDSLIGTAQPLNPRLLRELKRPKGCGPTTKLTRRGGKVKLQIQSVVVTTYKAGIGSSPTRAFSAKTATTWTLRFLDSREVVLGWLCIGVATAATTGRRDVY